jgi:hypothetical protein
MRNSPNMRTVLVVAFFCVLAHCEQQLWEKDMTEEIYITASNEGFEYVNLTCSVDKVNVVLACRNVDMLVEMVKQISKSKFLSEFLSLQVYLHSPTDISEFRVVPHRLSNCVCKYPLRKKFTLCCRWRPVNFRKCST